MVNATVDNKAISITLADAETITVPTGETWKVTITVVSSERLMINNERIVQSADASGEPNVESFDAVLVAGDTVSDEGAYASGGVHIGGFVVA